MYHTLGRLFLTATDTDPFDYEAGKYSRVVFLASKECIFTLIIRIIDSGSYKITLSLSNEDPDR